MTGNEIWHQMTVGEAASQLKTDAAMGLDRKAARSRLRQMGDKHPLFCFARAKFPNPFVQILTDPGVILGIGGALLSLYFSEFTAALLFLAALLPGLLSLISVYRRVEKQAGKIMSRRTHRVQVIRGGKAMKIHPSDLVEGDVYCAFSGDTICADGRLISATSDFAVVSPRFGSDGKRKNLICRKSPLTLYPRLSEMPYPDCVNMVFAGSEVASGEASFLVTAVGEDCVMAAREDKILPSELPFVHETISPAVKPYLRLYQIILYASVIPLTLCGFLLSREKPSLIAVLLPVLAGLTAASSLFSVTRSRKISLDQAESMEVGDSFIGTARGRERLPSVTDLVLVGKGAFIGNTLHLGGLFAPDGEFIEKGSSHPAQFALCEAMLLRKFSEDVLPVHDNIREADEYAAVRRELTDFMHFDFEGLQSSLVDVSQYSSSDGRLVIPVVSKERKYNFWIFENPAILDSCQSFLSADNRLLPLDGAVLSRIRERWNSLAARAFIQKLIVREENGVPVFCGSVALRENLLPGVGKTLASLENLSVTVSVFLDENQRQYLPLLKESGVDEDSFYLFRRENPMDLKKLYGKVRVFVGVPREEILSLTDALKAAKHRMAVLTETPADRIFWRNCTVALTLGREADSPIATPACLSRQSDVILPRPSASNGGVSVLPEMIRSGRVGQIRRTATVSFLSLSNLLRASVIAIPLLFGFLGIPPYWILLSSTFADALFLAAFSRFEAFEDEEPQAHPMTRKTASLLCVSRKVWIFALLSGVIPALTAVLAVRFGILSDSMLAGSLACVLTVGQIFAFFLSARRADAYLPFVHRLLAALAVCLALALLAGIGFFLPQFAPMIGLEIRSPYVAVAPALALAGGVLTVLLQK